MNNTNNISRTGINVRQMVLIALLTAITCIFAPISMPIPVSPVPVSLATLVLYIGVFILPWKQALLSCLIYILLGVFGLPVFSGFSGGIGKLAGPTGGYLIGYFFLILIAGLFIEKASGKYRYVLYAAGLVLGTLVTYIFGTVWLSMQMGLTFPQGLAAGVIPYLPGDTVKIVIALIFGPQLHKRLCNIQQI